MAFQAFFDDSGSGVPVFVLSGFVSPVYWWEEFSKEWQELLDEPPRLKYFKMREAAQLCEQFGGMRPEQRNERVQKFFALINKAVQLSACCIIPIASFKKIYKGKIAGPKEWSDPYFIALWDMMTLLTEQHFHFRMLEARATKDSKEPSMYGTLDFIFDDNPRLAAIVPQYYQKVRTAMNPLVRGWIGASPRFENDHEFLPIQACDAQSWYHRRLFAEKLNDEPFKADLPKSVFASLDAIPAAMSFWSSERMRKSVESINGRLPAAERSRSDLGQFKDIHDLLANANLT